MKDIYVPKKVPRIEVREKLHGHTTIDLFNTKTKKYERVEHDNMFTDGIGSYFGEVFGFLSAQYAVSAVRNAPLWQTILGGILLFDTAIPTDPAPMFMPAGTTMVANGSYGVSNSAPPTELGSYNSIESITTAHSLSLVYDWNTSQGNGTIASVALTTKDGGYIGYGNASGNTTPTKRQINASQSSANISSSDRSKWSNARSAKLFYNGRVYIKYSDSVSIPSGATSVTVKSAAFPLDSIDVFMGALSTIAYDTSIDDTNIWDETITFTLPNALPETYICVAAGNAYPTCLLLLPINAVANGSTFTFYLLDVATKTVISQTVLNNIGSYIAYGLQFYLIDDTYALVLANNSNSSLLYPSGYEWYKINYKTGTVIGAVTNKPYLSSSASLDNRNITIGSFASDFLVPLVLSSYSQYIYDPILNTFRFTNGDIGYSYGGYNPVFSDIPGTDIIQSHGNTAGGNVAMFKNPLRLMSINNLGTPVTKTADKTMKVTYTITRASS